MKRLLQLLLFLALLTGASAWAACTCAVGASTGSCTAGSTVAQVNTCLGNVADGAVVSFAAGSYTWSTPINFVDGKGVSLIGVAGSTNVTVSGGAGFYGEGLTQNKPYRISGFSFTGTVSGNFMQIYPVSGLTLQNIRIDNNVFANTVSGGGNMVIRFGEHSPDGGNVTGVIHNNTFSGPGPRISVYQLGPDAAQAWGASNRGTANNIFVEDNTFTFTTKDDVGMGCIDGWQKASMVFRYNSVTNCQLVAHEMGHEGGFTNLELYGNTLTINSGIWTDGGRLMYDQGGGERMYFNNTLSATTGKSSDAIEVTHYRSCPNADTGSGLSPSCTGSASYDGNWTPGTTYRGYPCWGQPGRKSAGVFGAAGSPGSLSPMYSWLNHWTDGTIANISVTNPWGCPTYSPTVHVVANRDYYNSVSANANTSKTSPFNGTTGMGFGTKANRPDTCTASPNAARESGGGVAYWATDEGYWNSKTSSPSGVLYRCSATNTWVLDYVPYPYPHPLRSGLSAPTGLTVQ